MKDELTSYFLAECCDTFCHKLRKHCFQIVYWIFFFSYIKTKITIREERQPPLQSPFQPLLTLQFHFLPLRGGNSDIPPSPILVSCTENILANYPRPHHNHQSIFHPVKFIKAWKKKGDKQVIREKTKISVYNT